MLSKKCEKIVQFLVIFLLILSGYSSSSQGQAQQHSDSAPPFSVGMVTLLANPQKYEGKVVRTIGFLCIEFEGDALYLHEEDYRHGLHKNSFALRLPESQQKKFKRSNLKYVVIEGTIYANGPEQTDMWSGAIGDITRLETWPVDRESAPKR